ncbi:MAG: hypothetical protein K2J04_13940 [Lachnospiraceae bacterium]|nr:hypothetical protein [Lachnospiraceae bacterium]
MRIERLLKELYVQDEIRKEMILEKYVFVIFRMSRVLFHRDSLLKEIDFSERFHSRIARLNNIA